MKWLVGCFVALVLLAVGIGGLFMPRRVQDFYIGFYERHRRIERFNPLAEWMRTPSYITSLRLTGALALACFVITVVGLVSALLLGRQL